MKGILIYLFIVNLFGFLLMGIDKRRAIQHKFRIPEKILFLSGFLGGSVGAWAGMYVFRHKTRHWYFVWGMPLILLVQIEICWILLVKDVICFFD